MKFIDFKNDWARDWAREDVQNIHFSKSFVINILSEYYLKGMPNNKHDFKNYLIYEKGYDVIEAEKQLCNIKED